MKKIVGQGIEENILEGLITMHIYDRQYNEFPKQNTEFNPNKLIKDLTTFLYATGYR